MGCGSSAMSGTLKDGLLCYYHRERYGMNTDCHSKGTSSTSQVAQVIEGEVDRVGRSRGAVSLLGGGRP